MRFSAVKPSDHEVDVFKALHAAPGQLTRNGVQLGKRAVMPSEKVMVKNHRVLGPIWEELMGTFRKLNSHGAAKDKEAFGVGSHTHRDPPSRHDVNERELSRKKKTVPAVGHHGGTRAGHETYAVGKPQTTQPKEADTRAPPHQSYFHEPQHQPTMPTTAAHGKADGTSDLIKSAFARPFGSPDEI